MIKVLVVDDSALMRRMITDILNKDPDIGVIDTAKNGKEAIEKIAEHNPDVVTMDIVMPEMDGIKAIHEILLKYSVPIIALSGKSGKDFVLKAMGEGAIDFIQKPDGEISIELDKIAKEIIEKVKIAKNAHVRKIQKQSLPIKYNFSRLGEKIVVIGCSTGGPQTLEVLMTAFPKEVPCPIIIAQHMPPVFTKSFANRLNNECELEIREAKDGDELINGVALIAPGGKNMIIVEENNKKRIKIVDMNLGTGARPNIDMLFNSVAKIYKNRTIGVILTGMGKDGTEGCKTIKDSHGLVAAESDESSIIYGMPKSVVESGLADVVVSIEQMAVAILQLIDG